MSIQCLKCGYSVREPICASCIVNEINTWSREKKIKKNKIKNINLQLKSLLNNLSSADDLSSVPTDVWNSSINRCMICKKEMNPVCFDCVTNQASNIVQGTLKNRNFIESFHESFNTSLYDYGLNKNIIFWEYRGHFSVVCDQTTSFFTYRAFKYGPPQPFLCISTKRG